MVGILGENAFSAKAFGVTGIKFLAFSFSSSGVSVIAGGIQHLLHNVQAVALFQPVH